MDTARTLSELAQTFEYVSDGAVDHWTVMKYKDDVLKLQGDCDDYALTSLYILCDHNMDKFWESLNSQHAKIWYVLTSTGNGHAVLQYGNNYIDNFSKQLVTRAYLENLGHEFRFTFLPITVRGKMGLAVVKRTVKKNKYAIIAGGFGLAVILHLVVSAI